MHRVIAYVDGFNLYHGLRERFGRQLHWLDLEALATSLLRPDQRLRGVRYFTARVRDQPRSADRQQKYLAALAAHSSVLEIVEGRFQERMIVCNTCGSRRRSYEEKESDVNLAVAMVRDALLDRFDTALLISADADLAPAINEIRKLGGGKRVVAAFPPRRRSDALRRLADGSFTIGDAKLRRAQLPPRVGRPSGPVLTRPAYWS
ncbi:NYN domain-containing protein [Asanoa iriomotensis]|uniref:NYN domain-containing protein n=1 Tax=Asanoa iriomotensis TaxID=234613 RepID=A0ABQ4BVC5_9ACTN|nr:NYN domain-containing protein [Asanoa iriomotensis]GIF54474.1 hypothetical protein Air01nite_05690 [Asanoa iriomotensis]